MLREVAKPKLAHLQQPYNRRVIFGFVVSGIVALHEGAFKHMRTRDDDVLLHLALWHLKVIEKQGLGGLKLQINSAPWYERSFDQLVLLPPSEGLWLQLNLGADTFPREYLVEDAGQAEDVLFDCYSVEELSEITRSTGS